jgi:protocatechuate 3,4-dioxygenase beta subunit
LYTREDGSFDFLAIKPVSYPISNDGPVGALLRALNRHWMRPAHMHFQLVHPEYQKLVTALYTRDDKYVTSDTGMTHISFTSNCSLWRKVLIDGGLQVGGRYRIGKAIQDSKSRKRILAPRVRFLTRPKGTSQNTQNPRLNSHAR